MEVMLRFFRKVPLVFWCYFLPMAARTAGLLPDATGLYEEIVRLLLPAALILLLISVHLPSVFKVGKVAFAALFVGVFGIMVGGPLSVWLFRQVLPENAWMGFGALSGSWIGGSLNMAALKEALGTPNDLFAPMVFVDVSVVFVWMGFLISLVPYRTLFDRWNRSRKEWLEAMPKTAQTLPVEVSGSLNTRNVAILLGVAVLGTVFCFLLSKRLPVIEGIFSGQTWLVLSATTLAVGLSFTPLVRLEKLGASRLGSVLLYIMIIALGAQADLKDLSRFPLFVLVGIVWALTHGIILFVYGRIFRVPLFFLAVASQACLGGVVTTPIVAACYEKRFASLGLLLALLNNIVGTYLGFLTAHLIRLIT